MRPEVGAKIGRYTLEALLGRGGMAEVYRAVDDTDGSRHALKILHIRGEALSARLLREGRAQAALRHPNVLAVTGIIDAFGAPGVVMELVEGPDLQALLARGPLPPPQVEHLARGVLAGVAAAHARGLVHRDLKPSNVLLQPAPGGPVPKVADFGLVKAAVEDEPEPMTRTGAVMGTPGFMAPEQLRSAKHVDARADVFSLGALIYALASGAPPFQQRSLGPLLAATSGGHLVPLGELAPGLGPERLAVVARALAGDPEARFPDAGAMLAAWEAAPPLGPARWEELALEARERGAPPDALAGETLLSEVFDGLSAALEGGPSTWEEERALLWLALRSPPGAREACEQQAREALAAHGGVEVLGGARFLILFREAGAALATVRALGPALAELGGGAAASLHRGRVTLRENVAAEVARGARRLEASGPAVERGARALEAAPPGRLLATPEGAAGLAGAPGALRIERGWWALEGEEDPVALLEICESPTPPPPDSARAWRVVRSGGRWRRAAEVPTLLPSAQGDLVGREAALSAVVGALEAAPVVALLGGPGGGKSRAALALGGAWRGDFPGGVAWVDVGALAPDAGALEGAALAALAALEAAPALEAPQAPDMPPADAGRAPGDVGAALAARGRCLLILDGFDDCVGRDEPAVAGWCARAPEARVLVTSRVRPALGEAVWLGPLAAGEAAALFEARAQLSKPGFAVTDSNRADVAALVEALGGNPLAIELAAARARVMPPAKLLARLSDRARLLSGGRGPSMDEAIAASWARLTGWQQAALTRLAAAPGPLSPAQAEAALAGAPRPGAPAPDAILRSLVDHSWLHPGEALTLDPTVRDWIQRRAR